MDGASLFCPQVLNAVLSSLSHPVDEISDAASRADATLRTLIQQSPDAQAAAATTSSSVATHPSSAATAAAVLARAVPPCHTPVRCTQFEVHTLVHAISTHLGSEHVSTLLAALGWVHMLLKKSARRVMQLSQQIVSREVAPGLDIMNPEGLQDNHKARRLRRRHRFSEPRLQWLVPPGYAKGDAPRTAPGDTNHWERVSHRAP